MRSDAGAPAAGAAGRGGRRAAGGVPGYAAAVSPAGRWVARLDCVGDLERGAADGLLLGRGSPGRPAGRGRGVLVELRLGEVAAVGKRALRGGLLGPLLGDLHLGAGRAVAQVALAVELDRRGVPTPEVLAVGWRRRLGPLVRQAIVTRAIPRGLDLLEAARLLGSGTGRTRLLEAAAGLVRALHDAGFVHADLNLANLVMERGPAGERLHVVDLDRGRFVARLGTPARLRSLARLQRSHDKWVAPGDRLSPREEVRFVRRYCGADRDLLRRLLGGLRRARACRRLVRRRPADR
jgi:hypothetical protein